MAKTLHIVCLDIPSPPDYGGAVEMYYKIRALKEAGCHIILHAWSYGGRQVSEELKAMCETVYTYPRRTGWRGLHPSLPYIISSRQHPDLLRNLQRDRHPILFEGIHTSALLHQNKLKDRLTLLRVHNVEHQYYRALGKHHTGFVQQLYAYFEAGRLQTYEQQLPEAGHYLHISKTEYEWFHKRFPNRSHQVLPAFHANREVSSQTGRGEFTLYHGNLDAAENRMAVEYLLCKVWPLIQFPLIIAGRNRQGYQLPAGLPLVQLINNPDEHTLNQLLHNAHVHVLPALQDTGMKLKLLNTLYRGRHVLCNTLMLAGSGLENKLPIADEPAAMAHLITQHLNEVFTEEMLRQRRELMQYFDLQAGARQLIDLLPNTV